MVGPDGPVADVQSSTPVTSVTVAPLVGLAFGTRYILRLSAVITDLDEGTGPPDGACGETGATEPRKPLVPYETSFTTFAPEGLGTTAEAFTAGGLAIAGDRAYAEQNLGNQTMLRLFTSAIRSRRRKSSALTRAATVSTCRRRFSRMAGRRTSWSKISRRSRAAGFSRWRPTLSGSRSFPRACSCTTSATIRPSPGSARSRSARVRSTA